MMLRPIRPNPLIPTFTAIVPSSEPRHLDQRKHPIVAWRVDASQDKPRCHQDIFTSPGLKDLAWDAVRAIRLASRGDTHPV
jgi:hypothetical protein